MTDQQVLEPIEETVEVETDADEAEALTDEQPTEADGAEAQAESGAKSEREHRHLERLKELEIEVAEAEAEWLSLKASASTAKKEWEATVSRLRSAIRKGPDAQLTLPLGAGEGTPTAAPAPELWRAVPIGEVLKLTENQHDKLESESIKTLGDFEDLRAGCHPAHQHKNLYDLPGVGEKTADKWENAVLEWLSANRDNPESEFYVDPDPVEAADDETDDDDEPTPDEAADELDD